MSENLARCRRCHDVFDPDAGFCPRCGTPYQPIAAPPTPDLGTYAERYADSTVSDPTLQFTEAVPHGNQRTTMALFAGGAFVVVGLIVALALTLGSLTAQPANPAVIVSIAPPTSAAPSPTTRPEIAMALRALNDPKINAHVLIQNRVDVDSVVAGHPSAHAITLDCQVSNGSELVMVTNGPTVEEIRYVESKFYVRVLPSTKWATSATMTSWALILPLFNVQTDRMIEFVGNEQREGVATYHFRATNRWAADIGRLGFLDAKSLPIQPDRISLDIWTDTYGQPIYATFSGLNLATDGRKLVDIETTYTFTAVGAPVAIPNPMATPTPAPTPTPTPTPTPAT